MEEYASSLNLTYHQIHGWFAERRRRDRRKNEPLHSSHRGTAGTSRCAIKKMNQLVRQKCRYKDLEQLMKSHSGCRSNYAEKNHIFRLQILFPEDHILKKIFCKHGPVLGTEFDPPGDAFGHSTEFKKLQSCHDNQRIPRRSKVPSKQDAIQQEPHLRDCNLSLDESFEQSSEPMTLVDDEELELEELQEGPNPLRCSTHLASNGRHGCSVCKDLLARFPPQTVKMKQLFCTRPWDSSPGLVKQLFKVVQFIYTHLVILEVRAFTLDEFAQAFHDKDSLLLGVHVALLKLLMLHVEKETTAGFITPSSKICRFLVFLDFIREQDFDVDHWKQSLGPLTWTEILRQVLVAAGFGSKQNGIRRGNYNMERTPMEKCGLHPRTLKGEIFSLLSMQGNRGL